MSIDEIAAFVSIARLGGFARAAEALHRSQPAISRRIEMLEEELRAPVFERVRGGVVLSEAGRAFLPYAEAVLAAVKDVWTANKQIVFNGDNYSEDWHAEAERRGLSNLPQTPDALPALVSEAAVEVMGSYEVLSRRELESRYEVFVEQYVAKVNIEAETTFSMAKTMLLPAALRYLGELGAAGSSTGVETIRAEVAGLVDDFVAQIAALGKANTGHPEDGDGLGHAKYVKETVVPAMSAVRDVADRLESVVPDTLWPLPKYSEILFIK
jgi:glutamine synthetase